jgi:F-type H+-transporting ATPase subunit gamma
MDASDVAARTRTVAQLAEIVQAMRTLASAQRRQAQDRFSGLARYAAATRSALGEALALLDADAGEGRPVGARRMVVLLSEHGFVGGLDDALLARAAAPGHPVGAELVVVGSRGRRLCRERGIVASDGGPMPTTIAAVQSTAQRLIEELFDDVAEGRVGEIHVLFAEHQSAASWALRELRLFPPDVAASRRAPGSVTPLHTLAPRVLAARAMEEYAFAQVSWAVAEAFASERIARFLSMDAARHHIEDKLAELHVLERELRQEAITNEILEIASGAESFGGPS